MGADVGDLGLFANLYLNCVLIKTELDVPLCPSHAHPVPSMEAKNFVTANCLPRASHRECLTLTCTRNPCKRPRTNTPSGELQTILEQDPISFTNNTSKVISQWATDPAEANYALYGQHLHSSLYIVTRVRSHSQPA